MTVFDYMTVIANAQLQDLDRQQNNGNKLLVLIRELIRERCPYLEEEQITLIINDSQEFIDKANNNPNVTYQDVIHEWFLKYFQ